MKKINGIKWHALLDAHLSHVRVFPGHFVEIK